MKFLKLEYKIDSPPYSVWKALTDPKVIVEWGAGPAKMSEKENSEFSLWGGDIHGKNTKIVPNKELRQDWYGGDWDHPSKVIFKLSETGGKTVLTLSQTDIPEAEFKDIEDGWERYYLGEIKKLLES